MAIRKVHKQFKQKYVNIESKKPITLEAGFKFAIAQSGRSSWAIMFEMFRLMIGPRKIDWLSYFRYGLFRKELQFKQKTKYVTFKQNINLTNKLSPYNRRLSHGLFHDKILFNNLMESVGIDTPKLQLYVGSKPASMMARKADDWQQMQSFFENDVVFPVFCKPTDGTLGLGSVSIVGFDKKNKNLILGNDKEVAVEEFCQTIFKLYSRGYMIESFVNQHPKMIKMFGSVPTILRFVTAMERNKEPELLYTLLKYTGEKGMGTLDGVSKIYRSYFDPTTGQILSDYYQHSKYLDETLMTKGGDGTPVKDFHIPFTAEALQKCIDIHKLFPAHGWLGFDVVITDNGPVFLEGNTNPMCNSSQVCFGHGIYDQNTGKIIERVIASRAV